MAEAPVVRQYSGVRVPVDIETLFLNTLMNFGPPPVRPKVEFDDNAPHRAYFFRCAQFWRSQGCTGDDFGFQSFYNTKYIKWLNHNHDSIDAAKQS